jgi:hypothetical protein
MVLIIMFVLVIYVMMDKMVEMIKLILVKELIVVQMDHARLENANVQMVFLEVTVKTLFVRIKTQVVIDGLVLDFALLIHMCRIIVKKAVINVMMLILLILVKE